MLDSIVSSFVLGLLTPLGAVCVLPLYPGFLAYLSKQASGPEPDKRTFAMFGVLVSLGVISFMFLVGLVFTTILQESLTTVIGVVSPIAFGILVIISLLLIFDVDFGRFIPKAHAPTARNPLATAYLYGFFFGAIVIPCNPGFIAIFLARTTLIMNFVENILAFLAFGTGIAFPLLAFSLLSTAKSKEVINFLSNYQRQINVAAGVLMLVISVYYLVYVFRVLG